MKTVLLTPGDPNGIGPECLIRAWGSLVELCRPVVCGGEAALRAAARLLHSPAEPYSVYNLADAVPTSRRIPVLVLHDTDLEPDWGAETAAAGRACFTWVQAAAELCLASVADALVTGPVSKNAWFLAGVPYAGHTAFLAELCGRAGHEVMAFASPELNVALVTTHIPLSDVPRRVTTAGIVHTGRLLADWLASRLDRPPRLALCGLNPHAGDGGVIGREDRETVLPAAVELRSLSVDITDPRAADTLFTARARERYDGVVALYHDQGLIPVKTLDFSHAVNVTLGLPFPRTSPAHGTAYDIAGKGVADEGSLVEAVRVVS
jgi:4-hydroxythreonine-4-phosphate dehydrogenase